MLLGLLGNVCIFVNIDYILFTQKYFHDMPQHFKKSKQVLKTVFQIVLGRHLRLQYSTLLWSYSALYSLFATRCPRCSARNEAQRHSSQKTKDLPSVQGVMGPPFERALQHYPLFAVYCCRQGCSLHL